MSSLLLDLPPLIFDKVYTWLSTASRAAYHATRRSCKMDRWTRIAHRGLGPFDKALLGALTRHAEKGFHVDAGWDAND